MSTMRRKRLGNSDLEVSVACLGTMCFGSQNTEAEAFEIMDEYLALGGNFLDTAELYPVPPSPETTGRTEEIVGRWVAARGCRDRVVLATKVMGGGGDTRNWVPANRSSPPDTEAPNARLTASQIRAAAEASLRRLQTTYIDLYQLHWPDRKLPLWGKNQFRPPAPGDDFVAVGFEEQVAAVGALIAEGKVRHWGLSNESTYGLCQMAAAAARLGVPPPVSVQNDFSLLDRRAEGHLAEAMHHLGVSLLPYGPLAGGTLTDKNLGAAGPPPGARHARWAGFQPRYHCAGAVGAARKYAALAAGAGVPTAHLALAWCASRWYVGATIIGATSVGQLRQNVAAVNAALDERTLAAVDAVHLERRNPCATD